MPKVPSSNLLSRKLPSVFAQGYARFSERSKGLIKMVLPLLFVHTILRLFVLLRLDAYGAPFVGKIEFYIFHAISYDFRWIVLSNLIFALFAFMVPKPFIKKIPPSFWYKSALVFHSVVLILTVFDHESMRFWGGHLSYGFVKTYINPAAAAWALDAFRDDPSVPYLPFILLLFCVPLFLSLEFYWAKFAQKYLSNQFRFHFKFSFNFLIISFMVFYVVTWLFTEVAWRGGHREAKLRPALKVLYYDFKSSGFYELSESEVQKYTETYQDFWMHTQGDSSWVFTNPEFSFYRIPLHKACLENAFFQKNNCVQENDCVQENNLAQLSEEKKAWLVNRCMQDLDGDGYTASNDCDDADSLVHPEALDIPSNGKDEDCNGIDAKPKNIVMIFLESHRAMHAGYLKEFGSVYNGTPFTNKLADLNSHYWTKMMVTGYPTVSALLGTHLGIIEHRKKFLSKSFSQLEHKSFTEYMVEKGYRSHFFSAADPSWDSQGPWLKKWYGDFSYDRSLERDHAFFNSMAQWMKDSLKSDQPFVISAISKSNHYPFNQGSDMEDYPEGLTMPQRMERTMRYTEKGLQSFVDSIQKQDWFKNTLVFILADHGFGLHEHGHSSANLAKFLEYTWIPLMIIGSHPELDEANRVHTEPASQYDLGPTVLDLVGITEENHFTGHSLIRKNSKNLGQTIFGKKDFAVMEVDSFRVHLSLDSSKNTENMVFNRVLDPAEKNDLRGNILGDSLHNQWRELIEERIFLNHWVLDHNKLWPQKRTKK